MCMSYSPEWRALPWCPRYMISSDGVIVGPSGRKLDSGCNTGGYKHVLIYPGDGSRTLRTVHSLVCETFHGPRPTPKHHAAHRDGDKTNNAADNLRWATAKENIADKVQHGTVTRTRGEICGQSKLTAVQVSEIRGRWGQLGQGENQKAMAREYGVSQPTISNIITRKTWSHI